MTNKLWHVCTVLIFRWDQAGKLTSSRYILALFATEDIKFYFYMHIHTLTLIQKNYKKCKTHSLQYLNLWEKDIKRALILYALFGWLFLVFCKNIKNQGRKQKVEIGIKWQAMAYKFRREAAYHWACCREAQGVNSLLTAMAYSDCLLIYVSTAKISMQHPQKWLLKYYSWKLWLTHPITKGANLLD